MSTSRYHHISRKIQVKPFKLFHGRTPAAGDSPVSVTVVREVQIKDSSFHQRTFHFQSRLRTLCRHQTLLYSWSVKVFSLEFKSVVEIRNLTDRSSTNTEPLLNHDWQPLVTNRTTVIHQNLNFGKIRSILMFIWILWRL